MAFSDSEREALLAVKGVGPTVLKRLLLGRNKGFRKFRQNTLGRRVH